VSSKLFGAKSTLLSYSGVTLAFATTPDFEAAGKAPAIAYFTQVVEAVEEVNEIVLEVATDAEAVPAPPAPAPTLQDLVQAGRTRLKKERARRDRDEWAAALTHVRLVRERLES
jgi:hypothetical protein